MEISKRPASNRGPFHCVDSEFPGRCPWEKAREFSHRYTPMRSDMSYTMPMHRTAALPGIERVKSQCSNLSAIVHGVVFMVFRPEGPAQLSARGNAWGSESTPFIRPERARPFSTEDRDVGKLRCPYRARARTRHLPWALPRAESCAGPSGRRSTPKHDALSRSGGRARQRR
jgi:hypothetical protein